MNLSHRVRTVAATALLTVAASSAALAGASSAFAATTAPAPRAAVQCRINFQASSLNLKVGQDLVLSWTAIGADKLTASWTTGFVPFVGAVTTTMAKSGTFSYQVTGTSNGLYCGGAGVDVHFADAAAAPSTTVAPQPSPTSATANQQNSSTSTGNAGGVASGGGGYVAPSTTSAGNGVDPTSTTAGYPTQSPTSGTGVPWYQDPMHLLVISALALLSSLLLWRREQLRAVFIRQH